MEAILHELFILNEKLESINIELITVNEQLREIKKKINNTENNTDQSSLGKKKVKAWLVRTKT